MVYKNIKKRTFEIIQASTEHDLASKIFDICLIVLFLLKTFYHKKRASGIKLLRQRKTNLLCFRMMVSPKKLS